MKKTSKFYGLFSEDEAEGAVKYSIQEMNTGKNKGELITLHFPLKGDLPENPTNEEIVVKFAENIALKSKETWMNLVKPAFYQILGERSHQVLDHVDGLTLGEGESPPI